jgi:pimeloyl-ACP methyl ester carboxylesterase
MNGVARTFQSLALLAFCACGFYSQEPNLSKADVNGVELNYIEKGSGEPLILLHGGLFDYRSWDSQFDTFAGKYRVISYSRRYNFPNVNEIDEKYKPGRTDAEDLKALIKHLGLKKVHLVGLSYGAFTGLIFASENPEMVLSMVLAEPPAHQLIRDLPGGEKLYQDLLAQLRPMVAEFLRGDDHAAIASFNRAMGRDLSKIPAEAAARMLQNSKALKAINLSREPFPSIKKTVLNRSKIPTLMVKGERADQLHAGVTDEIVRLMPNARAIVVPAAGHNSPRDNPEFFNKAVLEFLDASAARGQAPRRPTGSRTDQ